MDFLHQAYIYLGRLILKLKVEVEHFVVAGNACESESGLVYLEVILDCLHLHGLLVDLASLVLLLKRLM